ncbi:MAG: hypothetical protein JO021_13990 [Alphaproteobacteria bacterium]|nr:hypothetical protein [Alphaproteobacteria bacterium]
MIPSPPWLTAFCLWLEQTAPSLTIQKTAWIVPTVQSIHILAIAAVATSALLVNLRLAGGFATDLPGARVAARFLPFVWWPLLVLLATGAVMITGEPGRSLKNPAFQLKMALLLAALVLTVAGQRRLRRAPPRAAGAGSGVGAATRALAVAALLLWVGVIVAGRWIAYS